LNGINDMSINKTLAYSIAEVSKVNPIKHK